MPVESAEVQAARAEVIALRQEFDRGLWLLKEEGWLVRFALACAHEPSITVKEFEERTSETVRLGGTNPYRDAKGRYAPGPHAPRPTSGSGGGRAKAEADREVGRSAGGGSSSAIHVENSSPAYRARIHELVGRSLSDGEIAGLAGARAGDRVVVGKGSVTVHRADGSGQHSVSIIPGEGSHGRPAMLVWANHDAAGREVEADARVLAVQVRTAQRLGFERISTQARPGTNDYQHLPRLGYNCSMKQAIHESRLNPTAGLKPTGPLPRSARGARTLVGLLKTPEGAAWWRSNGLNPALHLDLARRSQSVKTLNAYLRAHGEELQP
jgi:hypothetical protein